ncbi:transketolase [bacterium]
MDYSKYVQLSKIVRRDIIEMLYQAGSGHPGGSLSCVELIVALYFKILKHKPDNPCWEDRDRVIFSKGHVCPTQYACLAHVGYFPVEELLTLRKIGSKLQGHPGYLCNLNGIEVSTGSLGQGLSIGCGMALGLKADKRDSKVYVLLGDGELQAGQIWEAAMTASHYNLDNLCAIVDYNGLQIDGKVDEIMNVAPVKEKFESFGWQVLEIDGHKYSDIFKAYEKFLKHKGTPTVIIANTVKGKGVSYMEHNVDWHGKSPNKELRDIALKDIEKQDVGV